MVGSCNTDLIAYALRLPALGETLHGTSFAIGFGGKGANQAVIAARLGAQVKVIASLGNDTFGENTLANFTEQGIDTTYVQIVEGVSSGVAPIWVDTTNGHNSIIIVGGANDRLMPDFVRASADAITSAQAVMCQLEIPLESTIEVFRIAQGAGVITILNPAPAAELPNDLLTLTEYLIPNEIEAATLTGISTADDVGVRAAAEALRARGVANVIITLGARGALLITDAGETRVSVEPVQAVDTTGAGDCFVGSFAYLLAAGRDPVDAVRRACAIAARSVLKPGTQSSFPYRDEVLDLM